MAANSSLRPTTYTVTRRFIRDRTARVGVLGLGRVGLRLAIWLSRAGFLVHGLDFDATRASRLRLRESSFWGIDPSKALAPREPGIHLTCDPSQIAETDVVILSLPTIRGESLEPDLRVIRETAFTMASQLHAGQLIIIESPTNTSVTEEILVPILEGANSA